MTHRDDHDVCTSQIETDRADHGEDEDACTDGFGRGPKFVEDCFALGGGYGTADLQYFDVSKAQNLSEMRN